MTYNLVTGEFDTVGRPTRQDVRTTVGQSVQVIRMNGRVGQPGSKRKPSRSKLHKGKMALCPHCNPVSYVSMRRLEEKFTRRGR